MFLIFLKINGRRDRFFFFFFFEISFNSLRDYNGNIQFNNGKVHYDNGKVHYDNGNVHIDYGKIRFHNGKCNNFFVEFFLIKHSLKKS